MIEVDLEHDVNVLQDALVSYFANPGAITAATSSSNSSNSNKLTLAPPTTSATSATAINRRDSGSLHHIT